MVIMDLKKELEKTYNKTANVIVYENSEIDGLISDEVEVLKYENIKCDISHKTYLPAIQTEVPKAIMQIKIFMSNEYNMPINSKIVVTDENNRIKAYKSSSIPAVYDTHQEIILEEVDTTGDTNV